MFAEFGMLGLGFLLGIRHAFDADHIVAISTVVSQSKKLKTSTIVGMFWGFGHTFSLLIVGLLILLLKISISPKIATIFEVCVGFMLVYLGVNVFIRMFASKGKLHAHAGFTLFGKKIPYFHTHKNYHGAHDHHYKRRSFLIGIIHGLAGSAALMLLVLASATSVVQGLVFILSFGVGLILSMIAISTAIGLPFSIGIRIHKTRQVVIFLAGLTSVVFGIWIVIEQLFLM